MRRKVLVYGKTLSRGSRKYLGWSPTLDPLQGTLRVKTEVWLHARYFLFEMLFFDLESQLLMLPRLRKKVFSCLFTIFLFKYPSDILLIFREEVKNCNCSLRVYLNWGEKVLPRKSKHQSLYCPPPAVSVAVFLYVAQLILLQYPHEFICKMRVMILS